jgi:16S rRNA C967 or C1407 C5-methylase (RsmB/RsmF family)
VDPPAAAAASGRKPVAGPRLDVQLLPERHGTDGFYIAGMRRKG